jgi:virginiamycin B lyase
LGHFEPRNRECASPGGSGSPPYGITTTLDGMIWYSESGVQPNTLVRFDPKTKTFAERTIPSGGGVVRN